MPTVGFDFDDTLVANPYGRLFYRPWVAAREAEAGVEPGTYLRKIAEIGRAYWRRGQWCRAFDWPAIARDELGIVIPDPPPPDPDDVAALLRPGALDVLGFLLDRGVDLALVTNGMTSFQRPYLEALGWDRVFRQVVTPDRVGTAKPDPRMFWAVKDLVLFVGDRPWHDTLGAKRAGVPAVMVGPGPLREERHDPWGRAVAPDFRVDDLFGLLELFRSRPAAFPWLAA